MRSLILIAPLALLVGATGAQAKAPPASEQRSPERKRFDDIVERMNVQREEAYEKYRKATTEAEREAALARTDGLDFLPEFKALAAELKGSDVACDALLWVLRLSTGNREQCRETIDTLLEDHMESAALAPLTYELRGMGYVLGDGPVSEALRAMIEFSPHKAVQGGALFALGCVLMEARTPKKSEGRACFERIVREFGELRQGDGGVVAQAERYLFELDHLQIGMVAPDFESVDENGAKWKLSDYKGKVVVVDFWGFW